VEKYVDNIIRRVRIACWITKATDTSQNMVILIAFHGNSCYANAPQFYICTYNDCLVKFMKQSSFPLYLILV